MKKLCILFVIGFMAASVCSALGTSYYVKNGGNDSAAGTSDATAWATFNNINSTTFQAGDVIYLKCGSSWNQQMTLNGSGTSSNKIQITSYGSGSKPRIYRSNIQTDYCIYGLQVDYWKITNLQMDTALYGILMIDDRVGMATEGIEIRNCDFSSMNYLCSSYPLQQYGTGIFLTGKRQNGAIITDCTFYQVCMAMNFQTTGDVGYGGGINSSSNISVADCTVEYSAWGGIAGNSLYSSTIDNVNIYHTGLSTTWPGPAGMQFYGASFVTVKNCEILHTYDNADSYDGCCIDLDVVTNNITIEDCILGDSEGPAIEFLGDSGDNLNMTIKDCLIYDNCKGNQEAGRRYALWAGVSNPTGSIIDTGFYNNGVTTASLCGDCSNFSQTRTIHSTYVDGWTPVFGLLTQLDVGGNGYIWGTNGGSIYQWNGQYTGDCWNLIAGYLTQVTCGNDGDAWGLNGTTIFRNINNLWYQQAGSLSQISCGSASNTWGVNSSNYIFRFDGTYWWQIPGTLQQIDASATFPYAWGVNSAGYLFHFDGNYWYGISSGWTQVSCQDYNIAVAKNSNGYIYKTWNGGVNWTQLPGVLSKVSIGSDGKLWGLASDNTIWRYDP